MNASIFLAQALGLYLLIVGFSLIINASRIKPLLIQIIDNPALLFVSGFMALIIGIALVVSHNLWVADWRVLITITAWLAFLKGIVRIVFPQVALSESKKWVENDAAYYTTSVIVIIIGLVLGYHGFI